MRRLSLLDVILTLAVLILLVYLGSMEFAKYGRRPARAPAVSSQEAP
jgi:hypothetical protein